MKFKRAETVRFLRLGKKRRNLQKWRRPKGRHSKMRKKRAGYPISPSIGYGKPVIMEGMIKGKTPVVVNNVRDVEKSSKENILVIGRKVGAKKKIEMIKKAKEMKLDILNVKEAKQ